jgi:hypothetical protein
MDEPLEEPPGPSAEHENLGEHEDVGEQGYLGERVDEDLSEREVILQSLYSGEISPQVAAERLALETLKGDKLESGLMDTWGTILREAYESTNNHQTLVELLATIAKLPPAKDDQGNQLKIYDIRVWGESRRYFGLDDVQLTHWP